MTNLPKIVAHSAECDTNVVRTALHELVMPKPSHKEGHLINEWKTGGEEAAERRASARLR
jgi:hypothetical protein